MKHNTEMMAEARVLDLDRLTTPEEMMELGVELVLVGSEKIEERKRRDRSEG